MQKELQEIGEFHIICYGIEYDNGNGYCAICKGECKAVEQQDKYGEKLRIISIKPAKKRKT